MSMPKHAAPPTEDHGSTWREVPGHAPAGALAGILREAGRRVWYLTLVRGLLLLVLGVLAVAAPLRTAWNLALAVGIVVLVEGVVEVVEAFRHRRAGTFGLHLASGLVAVLFGTVVLAQPGLSLVVLVYTTAFWSILHGVLQLVLALTVRGVPGGARAWGVVSGVLSAVFGLLLLTQPAAGLAVVTWIVGVWALVAGGALVALAFYLRRIGREADPAGARDLGPEGGVGAAT